MNFRLVRDSIVSIQLHLLYNKIETAIQYTYSNCGSSQSTRKFPQYISISRYLPTERNGVFLFITENYVPQIRVLIVNFIDKNTIILLAVRGWQSKLLFALSTPVHKKGQGIDCTSRPGILNLKLYALVQMFTIQSLKSTGASL